MQVQTLATSRPPLGGGQVLIESAGNWSIAAPTGVLGGALHLTGAIYERISLPSLSCRGSASGDPFFDSQRDRLIVLAAHHAIPAIYQWR
jgi:hypothetical protein